MSARGKIIIAVLVVLVLAAAALLLLPRLADVDRFRPRVIASLEQQTGQSIELGHLTLAILPELSIRADQVAVGNPPGFPQGHFLEIRRVYVYLDFISLLQRRFVIKSLELDEPIINLLTNGSGGWNTAAPRPARIQPAVWVENPAEPPVIGKVQLNHGRVTYASVSSSGQAAPISFDAESVSAELHDVNPQALGINLNPAGVRLLSRGPADKLMRGGTSSPAKRQAAWNPASAGVTWLDLGTLLQRSHSREGGNPRVFAQTLKPLPSSASLRLLDVSWAQPLAADAQTDVSPQGPLAARGTVSVQSAHFGNIEITGFKSDVELHRAGVRLSGLNVELCGGQVTGDLVWDSGSQPHRYATHLTSSGIDAARLLMAIPNARGKLTGTIEGHLDLSGWTPPTGAAAIAGRPLAEGTGELTVRNGTLPALQLNGDMKQLLKNIVRTGSADLSSFRSISADLEIASSEIRSRQITILGNGIEMDVSGSLALDGAGQLNYQGVGKIDVQRNGYSNVLAGLLGSKISGGRISFPFTLTGTLESPHFGIKSSPWLH
jgi:uncharacterized protein involved in outer membrane biogenesis